MYYKALNLVCLTHSISIDRLSPITKYVEVFNNDWAKLKMPLGVCCFGITFWSVDLIHISQKKKKTSLKTNDKLVFTISINMCFGKFTNHALNGLITHFSSYMCARKRIGQPLFWKQHAACPSGVKSRCLFFNINSSNGLLHDGTKPLPELIWIMHDKMVLSGSFFFQIFPFSKCRRDHLPCDRHSDESRDVLIVSDIERAFTSLGQGHGDVKTRCSVYYRPSSNSPQWDQSTRRSIWCPIVTHSIFQ